MESIDADQTAVIQRLSEYGPIFQQEHRMQTYDDMDIARDDISTISPGQSLDVAYNTSIFARQGGSAYSEPARQALDIVASNPGSEISPDEMWKQFCARCEACGYGLNDNLTEGPMTDLPRIVNEQGNLFAWIDSHIEAGTLGEAEKRLRGVKGIATKIARLTIRQAVWALDRESDLRDDELAYLHPIDVQIARIIQAVWSRPDIEPRENRDEWAQHLVSACATAGVSNIEFNQGAWYWASEVFDQPSSALEDRQIGADDVGSPSSESIVVSGEVRKRFKQHKTRHGYQSDEAALQALLDAVER